MSPRIGHAQNARNHLTQAIVGFGQGKLDAAKRSLDQAEASTSEAALLSKIHRQRGIIFEVENQQLPALLQFLKALYYQPDLTLSKREHHGRVSALFDCAKRLGRHGYKAASVRERFTGAFLTDPFECPIKESGEVRLQAEPTPAKSASKMNPTLVAAPPPPISSENGWLSSPRFWIITSLALAAGATTAGFLFLSPEGGDYGGSTATTIRLSN